MPNILAGRDMGSYAFDASAQTITFSGLGTVALEDIFLITNVTDNIIIYNFASAALGGVMASNVLTLDFDTTSMDDADELQIVMNYNATTDFNLSSQKVIPQANSPHQKTDAEELVSAQNLTAAYANFGAEIDISDNRYLGLWVVYDVNDSDAVDLKLLGKYESGGTDEFEIDGLSVKRVFNSGDSDGKIYYEFDTGTINYIRVQAIAGTVGTTAGDLTININKYDI